MGLEFNHRQVTLSGGQRCTDELKRAPFSGRHRSGLTRRVEAGSGRASPAPYPARQSQASARLNRPSARPHSAAPPFRTVGSPSSLAAAAAAAPLATTVVARHRLVWPLLHHRNPTTVSPAPHCFSQCPLFEFGKRQRRANAHRSPVANSVVVATPP